MLELSAQIIAVSAILTAVICSLAMAFVSCACAICAMRILHEKIMPMAFPAPSAEKPVPTVKDIVAAKRDKLLAAKASAKNTKSCAHCAAQLNSEPSKGIIIDTQAYNVYECPGCKKQTMINA